MLTRCAGIRRGIIASSGDCAPREPHAGERDDGSGHPKRRATPREATDLADPDAVDIDRLVASQAWAESVPEHHDAIARSVRSALAAPIVQTCRTNRHHKELFVAAPIGSVTIEGYVDLLVDTPDGLIVVDYKTDSIRSEADVDAKLDQYAIQGAAYAVAVETATGQPVVDVRFVFTRPDGPIERPVDDLEALRGVVGRLAADTAVVH